MSIGEYYKMLVDGKRPTRQRTHDPPKPTSAQPKASLQTLKLKKPDKKEEQKEKHHSAHPPHKDHDEKKRDEKLIQKIKTKENLKDIKTLKDHQKADQADKIKAQSEAVPKEKVKPKSEPAQASSEQSKLRHHATTLAPKKEQEQRQKIHQTQQVQQTDESDFFESISPHPKYIEDRFCDYIDEEGNHSFGKFLSFNEDSQQFILQYYNEPQRQLKVNAGISNQELPQLEVLTKPYLCKLLSIPLQTNLAFFQALNNSLPPSVANSKISQSKFQFPIVQALNQTTKEEDPHLKGSTHYHFKVLIPQGDQDNEEMKDEEVKGEGINHHYQLIDLTFKEGFNPLKDLKPYDSEQFLSESNQEILSSLFLQKDDPKDSFFSSLDSISLSLQNASKEYLNKTASIILTKDNMNDMLFSLCKFETLNKEQQVELDQTNDKSKYGRQKQGILLRIKYDPHYQDYLLMFRITLSKQFQKERIEWIQLSKHRIRSDLSKGYVSIDFLQNFENISTTNQKIKVKNIQFVSYFESQLTKQDLKDPSFEDHIPQNQLSENKAKSSKIIKARGECCNYTTEDIASLQCSNCNKVYHEQCLQSEHLTLLSVREKKWRCNECIRCTNCLSVQNRNLMMICTKCNSPFHYDCLDQSVKLSVPFIGLQEKELPQPLPSTPFLPPLNTNSTQPLPQSLALTQIKSTSPAKVSAPLAEIHYKCENCIFCEHCGARQAGKNRLNKWSKDFKLCSKCNKKKKNKQYCAICEMFWPNQEKEQRRENWNLNQTKHSEEVKETALDKPSQFDSMTFCVHCQMWIHNKCDRMLQNETIRDKFKVEASSGVGTNASSKPNALEYNCPDCRQDKRTQLIVQLVDNICAEDKYQFFQEPVEDRIKGYTKIVKLPMCFKYVKSQIPKLYLRNPEQLQQDITLIFNNAKLFNLPKHKVHKDAIKLDNISQQLIQSIWPTLKKYKLRTLDEDLHKAQIRLVIEQQKERRSLGIEASKDEIELDEVKFNYTPIDLFDQNEHQSVANASRSLIYQNSAIGALGQSELGNEEHKEGSEQVGGDEENDDTYFGGQRAQSKGLRVRKPFDYNEDRLLHENSDLSALGKRQLKAQRSSYFPQGDDESTFSLPQALAQVGRPSKRFKGSQDPDFVPYQYQSGIQTQRSDLLQQAIQQQQKQQQQQQNQLEHSSLALTGQDSFIANKQMESSQNQHIQQQQQMMMNYYQEIDDEKCYYSNPSRCSFDDPSLLFEEMCYLCGAFGNREDFLSCTLCGESFHTYCLSLPHDDISKFQSYWKCLNCKFCEICSSAVQENLLLYCDVCDKAFHSYCLKPKLEVIPNCGWKCQECFSCVKCHAQSFFDSDDIEQQKNKEVKDFKFSNNFSFCYQCGTNEYKKSFCSICKEKDETIQDEELTTKIVTKRQKLQQQQQLLSSEANQARLNKVKPNNRDQMMKCNVCQFYSHLRCSRVTQETIEELDTEEKKNSYKCLNCLLSGKTINHLIRESCEHYENIHQIISRQKLLAQICAEVLNKYIPIQEKAPLFIKNFVDQNQDFFKSNHTINEWLELLETNVCFESEDSQYEQTKDQSHPGNNGDENEEEKVSLIHRKESLWKKISERGIIDLGQEVELYEKGELAQDKVQNLFISLREIKEAELGQEREEDLMEIDKVEEAKSDINWYHEHKDTILRDQALHLAPQAKEIEKPQKIKQIVYKKWNDVTFDDLLPKQSQEEGKDSDQVMSKEVQSQKDLVEHELYAHKQSFLPPKRNLYKSLFYGDLYRQSQREHFANPLDLKNMITVPTEQNLQLHASIQARAEDYVKLEFKAVMQIRMQFFKWSEDLIKSIVKKNMKFLKRDRKQGSKSGGKENNSVRNDESHLSIDNVDPIDASTNKSQADGGGPLISKGEQFTSKLDEQIKNPQLKLTCILCKLSGELRVTGRLIPYQINQFVHINCALWSTDVYETEDGQLVNFYYVHMQRAKSSKCQVCGEYGATIYCFSRKCHNSYHFPCAYRQNKVAFMKNKETFCAVCCQQKELSTGYLEEYSTQRRLYIVKNIQPYLTNAFSNIVPGGTQTGTQALQGGMSGVVQVVGAQEGDKPFQIEKWRPFYYDMFNRVGNLTVLSLKKEINQIIEDIKSSFGPTSSSLQIESSQLNDFATIRIYWKFYKDQQMQIEDPNAMNPIMLSKGFYLYSNNQVREIAKNEFYSVLSHVSERVKDKVQWAINMSSGMYQGDDHGKSNDGQGGLHGATGVIHSQTNFWSKILTHFQKERPNFSLQNIEFSIQEFAGKTKYPISIWNRAEVKNKNFFLKSGLQQLAALCTENKDVLFPATQTNKVLQIKSHLVDIQASRAGGLTQDDIFKNMLKINQVGGVDSQTLLGGGNQYKRYICSKHMKYDQLLQQLGKKVLFFKAPPEEQNLKQQKEKDQLQKRLNKKLRITDTIDVNKQIDLPIAMKYRMCKAQPKRVEVGPSKIHRNGLFTLEDLMAGDIVIEYVGEKIRNKVADKREVVYEQKGIGDCYLFRLDKETIIDATFHGNKARYLNHCCDANCSAKIINVQGLKHIIISANRAIKSGEELTYNYNFDIEAEKLECYCGVANCLGRLN